MSYRVSNKINFLMTCNWRFLVQYWNDTDLMMAPYGIKAFWNWHTFSPYYTSFNLPTFLPYTQITKLFRIQHFQNVESDKNVDSATNNSNNVSADSGDGDLLRQLWYDNRGHLMSEDDSGLWFLFAVNSLSHYHHSLMNRLRFVYLLLAMYAFILLWWFSFNHNATICILPCYHIIKAASSRIVHQLFLTFILCMK